jgi:hypothetical protein
MTASSRTRRHLLVTGWSKLVALTWVVHVALLFRFVWWDLNWSCQRTAREDHSLLGYSAVEVDRRFRGVYCLHHRDVEGSNETTRRYIPEGSNHHTSRRENLKSHEAVWPNVDDYIGLVICNYGWSVTPKLCWALFIFWRAHVCKIHDDVGFLGFRT